MPIEEKRLVNIPEDVLEEFFKQYFSKLEFRDQKRIIHELLQIVRVSLAQNRKEK